MIYKNSLFNKEIRQSYIDSLSSMRRLSFMCIFLAVLTIIVYLLLQIMYDSVITELMPEIMLPSYFTIAYIYNWVNYIFFASYFMIKYKSLTLSEIGENKWYMLSKMGYKSTRIILYKMLTSIIIVLVIYAAGFVIAMMVASILKFTMVWGYFIPTLTAGALNVLVTIELTLVISLFSDTKAIAKNRFIITLIISEILKIVLGYYKLITSKVLMVDIANLFNPEYSYYPILSLAVAVILPLFGYWGARKKSNFYSVKNEVGGITIVTYNDNRVIQPTRHRRHRIFSLPSLFAKIVLMLILIASIGFNTLILIASLGSSTKEFSILGYIPYIIQSSTMEPTIYKNDLALFKKIDSQYPIKADDVILFTSENDDNEVFIMSVVSINGDKVVADFLKYPVLVGASELQETVSRGKVYGIFFGNYRIVGAIILFINTFPGRMLTLFVPLLMLFFYTQITEFYKKVKKVL